MISMEILYCFFVSAAHIKVMDQQKQNLIKQNQAPNPEKTPVPTEKPIEKGGRKGPEPTRYGDWELNGKCVDF